MARKKKKLSMEEKAIKAREKRNKNLLKELKSRDPNTKGLLERIARVERDLGIEVVDEIMDKLPLENIQMKFKFEDEKIPYTELELAQMEIERLKAEADK